MKKARNLARTHRKGAWTIGHVAAEVTGAIFERHGLGHGEIAYAWPQIVGAELASVCRPEALAPAQKGQRGGTASGGTLHVVACQAQAVDVHYAADRIIRGVNALYGHQLVAKVNVKISHTDAAAVQERSKIRPVVAKAEDPDRFDQIHTAGLRHALARLEAGILTET